MRFKDWMVNNSNFDFWLEFMDVNSMSTKDIEFKKHLKSNEDFDEETAMENCMEEAYNYIDREEYFSDIYDDIEDDPDFYDNYGVVHPEIWLEDNPEPETDSDEYQEWKKDYDEIKEYFKSAIRKWEDDMHTKRLNAEERMSEEASDYAYQCVEEAKAEWENEQEEQEDLIKTEFDVEGDKFKVTFTKTNMDWGNWSEWEMENVWDITFEGPKGTSLTNKNKNPTLIYKNLLLSIKKLIETEVVDGLTFVAGTPSMTTVYRQFFKQFLSKDFIEVDHFFFVKKEIVRNLLKNSDDAKKSMLIQKLLSTSRLTRKIIKKTKEEKQDNRNLLMNAPIGELFELTVPQGKNDPVMVTDSYWDDGRVVYQIFSITPKNDSMMNDNENVKNFLDKKFEEVEFNKWDFSLINFRIGARDFRFYKPINFQTTKLKKFILNMMQQEQPVQYQKLMQNLQNKKLTVN